MPLYSFHEPTLSYSQYLLIVIVLWLVLFIMWMRALIWDIKLNKINEELSAKLSQAQEEIMRLQSNPLSSVDNQHQLPSSCPEKYDSISEDIDSSN